MNSQRKQECRERIEKEGWNRIGIIDDEPDVRYWYGEKELELMYEDMDGRPCICSAVYFHSSNTFKATTGPARGNRMSYVIAWRPVPEPEAEVAAGAGDGGCDVPF